MLGRVLKEKGNFYCIAGINKIRILLDSKNKLKNGDLVDASGVLDFQSGDAIEMIKTSEIKVIKSVSKNLPILGLNSPLQERLKHRILDLRTPENHLLFILKSEIVKFYRNFFDKHGFIGIVTPAILGKITEGRVEKFEIDFYGEKGFLAMTKLPTLHLLICADFSRIYETSLLFVGGKQNTRYHVSEFFVLDWATSDNIDLEKQIEFIDESLISLINHLLNYLKLEINLEIDKKRAITSELQKLLHNKRQGNIISYRDLIKKYSYNFPQDKEAGNQLHLPQRVINYTSKIIGDYFWVIKFPETFKQFYCKVKNKTVLAGELWWRNIKVASISISEADTIKIKKRLKTLGLHEKNFKTYLDAMSYASSEATFGSIYIDRLTMVLFNLKNIREGILFPRAYKQSILIP